MLTRKQSRLFLCSKDCLCERLADPGGLAWYLGEGIVRFFVFPEYGASLDSTLRCGPLPVTMPGN